MLQKYTLVNGAGVVNNATPSIALIAANDISTEGTRVTAFVVAVTAAATGGSGVVTLKDGSTVIQRWDANNVMASQVNFGEIGYPITLGNALTLIVENAAGNQATAYGSAVGYEVG